MRVNLIDRGATPYRGERSVELAALLTDRGHLRIMSLAHGLLESTLVAGFILGGDLQ